MNLFNEDLVTCPWCGENNFKEEIQYGLNKEEDSYGRTIYKIVQPIKEIRCAKCNAVVVSVDADTNTSTSFSEDRVKYDFTKKKEK